MPPAYEVLLLNTAIPQIQAAQAGDTYVVPRDIAFSAALTLSAGTANGVMYLNGSKAVTTGSALTFDGTNPQTTGIWKSTNENGLYVAPSTNTLGAYGTYTNAGGTAYVGLNNNSGSTFGGGAYGLVYYHSGAYPHMWYISGAEKMRLGSATGGVGALGIGYTNLTSVGDSGLAVAGNVGIGTSSPAYKLDVASTANIAGRFTSTATTTALSIDNTNANNWGSNLAIRTNGTAAGYFGTIGSLLGNTTQDLAVYANTGNAFRIYTNGNNFQAIVDTSGNLGLGGAPSAWGASIKALEGYQSSGSWSIASGGGLGVALNIQNNAYYDGSNWIYKGSLAASNYYQQAGAHVWRTAASGTAGDAISFTQAMTLDASGNLVIGATTASAKLDVYLATADTRSAILARGVSDPTFELASWVGAAGSTDAVVARFGLGYGTTKNSYINFHRGSGASDGYMSFTTNGNTERGRFTSGGDFLVGKNSASATVVGTWIDPNGYVSCAKSTSTNSDNSFILYSTGASAYRFYVGMGGTISATNTTISAISDQRLKENIRDLDIGLNAIMALKPRKFDWKEGKGKDIKGDRGFIAQEFEQVLPDLIDEWKDPAPEGEDPYKAVRADLIPILVKAMQEQQAMINELKAEVAALKGA